MILQKENKLKSRVWCLLQNLISYIHHFKIKLGEKIFPVPVAVADSDNVPPILGRCKALDLFNVKFNKGREVIFLGDNKEHNR